MAAKIIGAVCIMGVCGGYGYFLAWQKNLEKHLLGQLSQVLCFMECELQYQMTPLPNLCIKCARETSGILKDIFSSLSVALRSQTLPDPSYCMDTVLAKRRDIPPQTGTVLSLLGSQLGRFDLGGQVQCINLVKDTCNRTLSSLEEQTQQNGKRYKTLGLCVGAALIIIFI